MKGKQETSIAASMWLSRSELELIDRAAAKLRWTRSALLRRLVFEGAAREQLDALAAAPNGNS